MPHSISRKLTDWKLLIFEIGLFVWFVVSFGDFIVTKIWHVLRPLFG
jgi:hypothetical protein